MAGETVGGSPGDAGGGDEASVETSSGAESDSATSPTDISSTSSAGTTATTSPLKSAKPAPKKPVEPEFKFKDKFKVHGKEEEREFDRAETRRLAQLGLAQDEGFAKIKEERAAVMKERDELARIIRGGKADPDAVLKLFGVDPHEYAAAKLTKHMELEQMSPEARRAMELEEKSKSLEEKLASYEKEKETKSQKEAEDRAWEEYRPKAMAAAKEFGLPEEPWVAEMIAGIGDEFIDAQLDLEPREHIRELDRRLKLTATRHIKSLDLAGIKALLGPEKLKALIADNVESARKSSFDRMQAGEPETNGATAREEPADVGISEEDFMAILNGKKPRRATR